MGIAAVAGAVGSIGSSIISADASKSAASTQANETSRASVFESILHEIGHGRREELSIGFDLQVAVDLNNEL